MKLNKNVKWKTVHAAISLASYSTLTTRLLIVFQSRASIRTKGARGRRGEAHACSACGKVFSMLCNLRMHQKTVHLGMYKYYCEVCGKGVRRKDELHSHMTTKHLKCPNLFCGMQFQSRADFVAHAALCDKML